MVDVYLLFLFLYKWTLWFCRYLQSSQLYHDIEIWCSNCYGHSETIANRKTMKLNIHKIRPPRDAAVTLNTIVALEEMQKYGTIYLTLLSHYLAKMSMFQILRCVMNYHAPHDSIHTFKTRSEIVIKLCSAAHFMSTHLWFEIHMLGSSLIKLLCVIVSYLINHIMFIIRPLLMKQIPKLSDLGLGNFLQQLSWAMPRILNVCSSIDSKILI